MNNDCNYTGIRENKRRTRFESTLNLKKAISDLTSFLKYSGGVLNIFIVLLF